jgi:stage II sporulation protein GA (sporulation sigma-E factor processing peptidase)
VIVYPDIIFLLNLVMNYLILLLTAKLSKNKTSSLRMFLGSIIGAIYAVFLILCPSLEFYYTVSAKILLSLLIVAVTFSPKKVTSFIKNLAIFYFSTFIFGGAAFAFLYFNQSGGFVKNGIVYVFWKSTIAEIILSILTVGIIIKIFWEVIQNKLIKEKLLIPLMISFEKKTIYISALVDTGNSLHDPLTNMPVVIVEFAAIKEILPLEIKKIYEDSKEEDLNWISKIIYNSTWISRFRLIPFTSLGKENGMLIGFKPDYIEVGENQEKRGVTSVVIGIYNKTLSKNERYKALLGPELVT